MAIEIRKMRETDRHQVMSLLAYWNIAPIAPTAELPVPERTGLIVENTHVALADGRIIGVISFIQHSPTVAEGASLGIDPEFQGAGIGERLLLASLTERFARGVRRIRCEVDRPETIRWLVERMGYCIVGTNPKRHAFGSREASHWTVLERDLGELPGKSA